MPYIKSFELDRWSEPDEKGSVRHIGMINMDEAFEKLKAHLESKNMLPDEYFSCNFNRPRIARELPDFRYALCNANFGASEGVYLDIDLIYEDDGEDKMLRFATGKTLKEGVDAFLWMSRIAAECSLMLNGRGCVYEKECTELVLRKEEAEALSSLLEQRQLQEISEQEQEMLYAIREQLNQGCAAETSAPTQEAEETDDEELER